MKIDKCKKLGVQKQQLDIPVFSCCWWNFMNKDDQIWLMMKYGYDNPFDPKRLKSDEIIKIYKLEHELINYK